MAQAVWTEQKQKTKQKTSHMGFWVVDQSVPRFVGTGSKLYESWVPRRLPQNQPALPHGAAAPGMAPETEKRVCIKGTRPTWLVFAWFPLKPNPKNEPQNQTNPNGCATNPKGSRQEGSSFPALHWPKLGIWCPCVSNKPSQSR